MILIKVLIESSHTNGDEYSFNTLYTYEESLKVCFRVVEGNLLTIAALTSHL